MRRPLRFVDDATGGVDLHIDATGTATVGDLADALAALTGDAGAGAGADMTVASRWPLDERASPPPRSAPLDTHGPRAGSTAVLLPASQAGPTPLESAPARLVGPRAEAVGLVYGANRVGDTVVEVTDHITVRALGASSARIGGAALLGSARLGHGDLLTAGGDPWTVCIDGPLRAPTPRGWTRPHTRVPGRTTEHRPTTITLPTPPAAVRTPGFPVLSATVPLLMAVALWLATGSLLAGGFMLFSVVFVVASGLEARREARAEDRARVAEFRDDLDEALTRLDEGARSQRRRHAAEGRTPAQLRAIVAPGHDRPHATLWERGGAGASPVMTVRLGTADRPREDRIVVPGSGRRLLRRELEEIADRATSVPDIVTVDLAATGGIVIDGADESAAAVARCLVAQLAVLIGPDSLGIAVVAHGDRAAPWRDAPWLPHCGPGRQALRLVVADGADPDEVARALDRLGRAPTAVVWVAPTGSARPAGIDAVLQVRDGRGVLRVDPPGGVTAVIDDIALEPMGPEDFEPLARCLSGLVPAAEPRVRPTPPSTPAGPGAAPESMFLPDPTCPPDSVCLADIVAAPELLRDAAAVATRWSAPAVGHLATPVGVDEHGGVVNLDLAHDGPHALVAGTTGAGKSELLRTFLVSAALHHSPARLQFLLVDYKGGAAFGPLADLPHTVGTITDLSGTLARRGLVSLRAELRRREEELAARGADRWTGAALLVVVDELATLVSEQPEFVDGLVDLAQRGRSLGIHLVLATQRPAGVVTDSIRANVTMRVALRVADEDDSRDVVDSAVAAHLPRDLPGRAVVRVGPGRLATLQVAISSTAPRTRAEVIVEPWERALAGEDTPDSGTGGATELATCVQTLMAAARLAGLPPSSRPWLDPLPDRIELGPLGTAPDSGALVIGTVDRPDLQRRDPLLVDLARDGGLIVTGASGSGTSTVLRTLAHAADRDPHGPWYVHVIDSGSTLDDLRELGAVGDVIAVHDTERVLRLLRGTVDEIAGRVGAGGHTGEPRRLVVIDGVAAFEELYERLDRGEAMDLLARIARDGRGSGVHLAVTARRRGEVPVSIAGTLAGRLVLRCATADEAALSGLDDAAAAPDLPPGRCRVGAFAGQVAVTDLPWSPGPVDRPVAPPVPRLPTTVRRASLATTVTYSGLVAVGLDAETFTTAHLDLRHHQGIVAGPPRSGVSTTLRTLVAAHPAAHLLVRPDADELAAVGGAALQSATSGQPSLVAIDDVPELLDGHDGDALAAVLDDLVTAARAHPVRIVLGGEVDAFGRCYHDVVVSVRRGRTGVLLGGEPEQHGALWHATLRTRTDLPPAPGRGWLLGPGSACRVQIAVP